MIAGRIDAADSVIKRHQAGRERSIYPPYLLGLAPDLVHELARQNAESVAIERLRNEIVGGEEYLIEIDLEVLCGKRDVDRVTEDRQHKGRHNQRADPEGGRESGPHLSSSAF